MSETKHTPGPWRTDAHNGFPLDIEDPGEYMIAKATPCAKAEANARLIAAAPDLLDLVRMVYLSFGGGRIVTFGDDDIEAFAAAIAKATGEQQ